MASMEDTPKCVTVFDVDGGIVNSRQLMRGLSALAGDLAAGRVTNGRANAICNVAGKMLTTVKLEQQYGHKAAGDAAGPMLMLFQPEAGAAELGG